MSTATAQSPPHARTADAASDVDAASAATLAGGGQAVIVDVREPDEHAQERIPGSRLVPLSRLTVGALNAIGARTIIFHCKGGTRSREAMRLAEPLRAQGVTLLNLAGGIRAWVAAGQPVERASAGPRLSVMRQVQVVIGVLTLLSSALAYLVDPRWVGVAAFLGAGLTFAGLSGTCGLALLLSGMPWNRTPADTRCSGSCPR